MTTSPRHALVSTALEACRLKVVSRLNAKGHPLSVEAQRLIVTDAIEGDGCSAVAGPERSALTALRADLRRALYASAKSAT